MGELTQYLVGASSSLRDVIACIDRNAKGIALVVDDLRHLLGTVTDGDVRRAVLAGVDLDRPVATLLAARASAPTTAPLGTTDAELLRLLNAHSLRHLPLLNGQGQVADLALLSDLVKEYDLPLSAVIMAGGLGTRLRPLTETVPKPMLPVGDRPLLELIVEQLRTSGVRRVNVATHYKKEIITDHFADGHEFGVEINYVDEEQPLGTAGALSLLDAPDEPLLVMNGDILARVDFRSLFDFHRDQSADLTIAVREHEFKIPYGVVESDGARVTGLREKPTVRHFVNAGIYLLNPDVCRLIPSGQRYDMPDLIGRLLADGRRVVSFPLREYWLDIGQHEDYKKALSDMAGGALDPEAKRAA